MAGRVTNSLDPDNIVKFYSKSADRAVRILSNFSNHPVVVDGVQYKTGEHAFQSLKFWHALIDSPSVIRRRILETHRKKIMEAETPLDAKKRGGKSKTHGLALTEKEAKKWSGGLALMIQSQICSYKFKTYEECRKLLYRYKNHYLLHQENRGKSPVWGGRFKDGKLTGLNLLGKEWMKLALDADLVAFKTFKVAGVSFLKKNVLRAMNSSDGSVSLVPEPDNIHDSNAVKVMVGEIHIGYVPRGMAQDIDINAKYELEKIGTFRCGVYACVKMIGP